MAYNNYDNSNYDKELGFKYHTQEFLDVSQELRRVGHIGRLAKRQVGMVQEFYDGIEYLDEIYSSYFSKPKEIQNNLEEIEKYIYDSKYQRDLREYLSLDYEDDKLRNKIKSHELKLIKKLKQIFKNISDDLVWAELRPRPSKVQRDEFADEENKVIREIMAGVKAGLKK